jgi:hypothetical protein
MLQSIAQVDRILHAPMLNLSPIGSGEFLQAWLLRGLSIYFFSRALVVRWFLMVVRRGDVRDSDQPFGGSGGRLKIRIKKAEGRREVKSTKEKL